MSEKEACQQALYIWEGGCNPLAISRTLAEVAKASLEWVTTGFDGVREHPACRVIAYQLAFLFGMEPLSCSEVVDAAVKACQRIVGEVAP